MGIRSTLLIVLFVVIANEYGLRLKPRVGLLNNGGGVLPVFERKGSKVFLDLEHPSPSHIGPSY